MRTGSCVCKIHLFLWVPVKKAQKVTTLKVPGARARAAKVQFKAALAASSTWDLWEALEYF